MVVDYRKVNNMTIKDHYTMANAETELDKLKSKKIFTKFDIQAGYNNIIIEPEDQYKATFKTQIGTYIPQVMPFGLCNAPPLFQQATNRDFQAIKQKYPNDFAHFMDDMCIGTGDTPEELAKHQQIVHKLLNLFEKHSYYLKLSKCIFEAKEIEFLGFQVGYGVASIDQSKMDGLCNWPRTLSTVKEVQQVLGVLGYQRPFIQNFTEIARLLTRLIKKGIPFEWTHKCRDALDQLIAKVTEDPKIIAPNPDKQFKLETDVSNFALGAILFQCDERGKRRAVGYVSHTLTMPEQNYDIWDKEFLGLIFRLTKWQHHLMCTKEPVLAFVDHANLAYYQHPQKINRRVARYISTLTDYNLKIIHKPGTLNRADALSRRTDYEKVATAQHQQQGEEIKNWAKQHTLNSTNHHWFKDQCLVVVEDNNLRRELVHTYHNTPTAGHAAASTTLFSISHDYWWPNMKHFVTAYVRGCATCQSNTSVKKTCLIPTYSLLTPKIR